ncbi:MAG: glucuronate isomerase [Kiritimatiellae bacterium]|nr:glucuronate isomerase [Kiritimatiellia bacterium]
MAQKTFITDDFLLDTREACILYHEYAATMPIVDYHCHLPPDQVARNHRFQNMTELWLAGDHYKWRARRANGVPEDFITGRASDREKFFKWAETVPFLLRNPLYHWTHLELARYFGITDKLLDSSTAEEIWEKCNSRLGDEDFFVHGLLRRSKVVIVCTTDDPVDTLEHHRVLAESPNCGFRMLPTWRPDNALSVECPVSFNAWVDRLEAASDIAIRDWDSFLVALRRRHDFFHERGCRISDHGLETLHVADYTESQVRMAFAKIRTGRGLEQEESEKFKSCLLHELAVMDWEKGWTQQFHLGALRNVSTRLFKTVGPNAGGDAIADHPLAVPLAKFLDRLDREGKLGRTILYNLNPRDNALLCAMIGSFQDGTVPGKLQFGSAWWFLDQKEGIERQIEDLSQIGLLSRFVGMLTDSRSFLSFVRHEYFRRILCNILGYDIARGLLPSDFDLVGGLVKDVCYRNAVHYFGFDAPLV